MAIRVAYTGELGWELHHPIEMQTHLWDRLIEAGEAHGLKLVGARAQNWLRQEKSYRAFGTELGRDATPLEAGLDRFVDLDKDFHGKAAMLEDRHPVEMRDGADRRARTTPTPGGARRSITVTTGSVGG
jgi:dimethylglycine dehydrogenase